MVLDLAESHFDLCAPAEAEPEAWDRAAMDAWFEETYRRPAPRFEGKAPVRDELLRLYLKEAEAAYLAQEAKLGADAIRVLERHVVLDTVDTAWKDHLYSMDQLKEGVGLRAYGQMDPLIEYKRDGYNMFARMMAGIKESVVPLLLRMEAAHKEEAPPPREDMRLRQYRETRPDFDLGGPPNQGGEAAMAAPGAVATSSQVAVQPVRRKFPKVGRNEPCPCGSGKKYKQCHGKDA